jgi:hypothetical protein
MQCHMLTAAEAQELPARGFAEDNVVFQHQKSAPWGRMPQARISAFVAHALLP